MGAYQSEILTPTDDNLLLRLEGKKPNIIIILTDDQDVDSMKYMPKLNKHLVERGVNFTEAFVTTPVCCPARVTFLRGQYAHNHQVLGNHLPSGGFSALSSWV